VLTTVQVHYTEEQTGDLDSVTILPDGASIPVASVQ
jgi:hypothetical protein